MEALNKHVLENNLVVLSTNVGHRKNMGRYSGKVFNISDTKSFMILENSSGISMSSICTSY